MPSKNHEDFYGDIVCKATSLTISPTIAMKPTTIIFHTFKAWGHCQGNRTIFKRCNLENFSKKISNSWLKQSKIKGL